VSALSVAQLPRIVRFIGTDDCEGASCPHCGATGRYIHRFQVADGRTLAAMSGCVKLFPVSPVAVEEARLRKKLADYKARGWNGLNRVDTQALDAIEQFYAGVVDERTAMRFAVSAKRSNAMRYRR